MNHNYHTKKLQTNSKPNKSQQYIYSWLQKDGGNLHLGTSNKKPAPKTETKTVRQAIDLTQSNCAETKPASRTTSFSSQDNSSGQLKSTSKFNNKSYNGQNAGKPVLSSFDPQPTPICTPRELPRVHPARPAVQPRLSGMSLVGPRFNNDTIFLPKKSNNVAIVASSQSLSSSSSSSTSSPSSTLHSIEYSPIPSSTTNPYTYAGHKRSSEYASCFTSEQALRSFEAGGSFGLKELKSVSSSADYTPTTSYEPTSKRSRTYSPSAGSRTLPSSFNPSSSAVSATSSVSSLKLSPEQERVLDMVVREGKSLFFTGSAGTGKSVLMRAIIDRLKKMYRDTVAVTASTGIAACNIGGCTLHRFAGIGQGNGNFETLLKKVNGTSGARQRWRDTRVLIIDEISMVDGDLFDKLDKIGRTVRSSEKPFGGIQVVLSGDFFQLPPVSTDYRNPAKFAFESEAWKQVVKQTVMLTHVFRQKEEKFIKILNEMRVGQLSEDSKRALLSLSRPLQTPRGIEPAELYPTREEVERSNMSRLNNLPGEERIFTAVDTGHKILMKSCIAPEKLSLKVKAQVMLLKNIDSTLVNGSLGTVIGFAGDKGFSKPHELLPYRNFSGPIKISSNKMNPEDEDFYEKSIRERLPIVEFTNGRKIVIERDVWSQEERGKRIASREQLPLILAWSMSIHKSQGQTLEYVKVDLGQAFERGQAYVALSRATSIENLQILRFSPEKVMVHRKVTEFYKTLQTV